MNHNKHGSELAKSDDCMNYYFQENNKRVELYKRLRQELWEALGKLSAEEVLVIGLKDKPDHLKSRSVRGSRFRGVSRNGKKWQVNTSDPPNVLHRS